VSQTPPALSSEGATSVAAAASPEAAPPVAAAVVRSRETAVALRNGLKMGSSLLVTWSVALIVKMQVPAHLGPVRQGHFGFAESFATMFFTTLGLGVDTYIAKEVSVRRDHASDIVGGVFALRVLMSVGLLAAMALVLWATGRSSEIMYASLIFGVVNLLTTLNGTLGIVLNTTARVGAAAAANILGKIVWGGGLLIGLHYNASLVVLALPGLFGEALRVGIMVPANRREAGLRYRINRQIVRAALIESIPFFVNSLALGVLGSLGMSALEFLRRDEREVGWFAGAQNLAYLCALLTPLLGWVVMPLLSRAFARSEEEGLVMLRRVLEGLVVVIVPITVLISAGSDVLIHFAFGDKFGPAHTALSILSLVFVMTYMDTMLAMSLIIMGKGWSTTVISISAVFITAGLMFVFVPLGRHLIAEGGESAGAAAAVIGSEACVFVAMLTRFKKFPLDGRNILTLAKTIAIALAVLIGDHQLRGLGPVRLVLDALAYALLALAIGAVRIRDIGSAIQLIRSRKE
jgi:O-antigen/teichoic acid export membrane protein